ncbi:MAG TPA: 5-methyltetrahydropteroyltriglutamate--homocysteine S-methyltransferase [Alphaproteobacteria bacterium]|nr:5-methyltetrahydropteroyltriglutamate--homocysteine S-methyltransferase [Alphaproteobacteria bacterium]
MTAKAKLNPPFCADHVGSLLRPKELTQAFREVSAGKMTAAAFKAVQDRAIRDAVKLQEELGLEAITDGEFRRASYWSHFAEAVDGLSVGPGPFTFRDDHGHEQGFLAPQVAGKVRRSRSISGVEFDFLRSVTRRTPKITMPSPPSMSFWGDRRTFHATYGDVEEYYADLATVFREEIADLGKRGARYIQMDDVPLAMLCDESIRATVKGLGEDPDAEIARFIRLFNDCLAGRPADMVAAIHICRGNFKAHYFSQGGYDTVAEQLFNEADVDAFFLEYDTPRAGDFSPLRHLPKDKIVVLGLVSTKTPVLESADALLRRIDEASKYAPIDQLALSPQCGFASTVAGNPVTLEDEKAKLRLVVEVARRVWG